MKLLIAPAACALAAMAGYSPAFAQASARGYADRYSGDSNGWFTIGEKTVNSRNDDDHIRVATQRRFRKIRLCALNRPFILRSISVVLENGRREDLRAGGVVGAGNCTHGLKFAAKRKDVRDIYLTYSRIVPGTEPRLIVQGK